ncbi:GNAT family N-acetyltransferase [Methanobacterium petrolearium]|uniref:GNAT family N-acetyltransferase n=1 Tax=Methanobacterium petrolearium TaxID=710190 RepID=UPI001AEB4B0C|nr:GNAT family N-acetyltransferase [Methanobacterium petrolearium]MBP1946571.1 N-acetylglutamate synthase-like GNAT family acetyltransferase [Methanobacterium petrolearium]
MEKIVSQEWNADWEKDIKPNLIKTWDKGEKKVIEKNDIPIGYFWFEKHSKKKEIFINSMQIIERCQRKGIGDMIMKWLINEAKNGDLRYIRGVVQTKNIFARKFFEKNKFQHVNKTESGLLVEKEIL